MRQKKARALRKLAMKEFSHNVLKLTNKFKNYYRHVKKRYLKLNKKERKYVW
jgi:hypothetical protein